jgi:hypothetical protein
LWRWESHKLEGHHQSLVRGFILSIHPPPPQHTHHVLFPLLRTDFFF